MDIENFQPTGKSILGNLYNQFKGKSKAAINFLLKRKEGNAVAALHHKDVGDIDLWYGNDKAGLKKIAEKHPEVLEDLQGIIDGMRVVQASENRVILESDTHKAVISKMLGNEKTDNWLLSAYEKKDISGGSSDIGPEPEGKQNGTAPLQNELSAGKDSENSDTNQTNNQENADDVLVERLSNHTPESAQGFINNNVESLNKELAKAKKKKSKATDFDEYERETAENEAEVQRLEAELERWNTIQQRVNDIANEKKAAVERKKAESIQQNGNDTQSDAEGEGAENISVSEEEHIEDTNEKVDKNAVQGLEGYSENELLDAIRSDIEAKLEEAGISDVVIKGMALNGSRLRGDAKADSDLDVVVEYEGDMSEDGLFNILNEEPVTIEGVKVDINPITRGKSGTLDEYMKRSRAYDEEQPQPIGKGVFGNIYDQFKGKVKEAYTFLLQHRRGDLIGVFHRNDFGDIDLVWGDKGGGTEHILDKHVGEGKSFATEEEAFAEIDRIIRTGEKHFENGDKAVFKDGNKIVTVRKNWRKDGKKIADKNWILTAYDETSADSESPVATNKSLAGLATDVSGSKDSKLSDNEQEHEKKNGKADEPTQRYHKSEANKSNLTKEEEALRDAVIELTRSMGLDVITDTEEGQKVLDMVNGGVKYMSGEESERRRERNKINATIDHAISSYTGKDIKEVRRERIEREAQRRKETKEIYEIILSGNYNDVSLQQINILLMLHIS